MQSRGSADRSSPTSAFKSRLKCAMRGAPAAEQTGGSSSPTPLKPTSPRPVHLRIAPLQAVGRAHAGCVSRRVDEGRRRGVELHRNGPRAAHGLRPSPPRATAAHATDRVSPSARKPNGKAIPCEALTNPRRWRCRSRGCRGPPRLGRPRLLRARPVHRPQVPMLLSRNEATGKRCSERQPAVPTSTGGRCRVAKFVRPGRALHSRNEKREEQWS